MMRIVQKMKVFIIIVCLITKIATSKALESNFKYLFTEKYVQLTTGTLIVDTNCPALWYLDKTISEDMPTAYNYTYEESAIYYLLTITDYVNITSVTTEESDITHNTSSPAASPQPPLSSSSPPPPLTMCSNSTILEKTYGARYNGRLSGVFERMKFVDGNGRTWNYSTAVFSVSGPLILSGNLTVAVIGYHSFRLESLNSFILINVPIDISGQNGGINKDNYAGGFGGKAGGPGAGGVPRISGTPGGGGFGGFGGGNFSYFDKLFNESFSFGAEYSFTESLIGGSAGAKWNKSTVVRLRGGGAMELNAASTIYVYSLLRADGQSSSNVEEKVECVGGGSGGMFLFNASSIVFGGKGFLSVLGGNGSVDEKDQPKHCGGGGAGGVIQLTGRISVADSIRLITSMSGGNGHPKGEDGSLKNVPRNRGGYSRDGTPIGVSIMLPPPQPPLSGEEKIEESTGEIKDKINMKPPSDLRHHDEREKFVKDVVDDFDQILNETDMGSSKDMSTLVFEVEDTVSLLAKTLQEAKDDNETLSVTASNNAFEVVISIEEAVTYEGTAHQARQLSIYIPETIIEDNFTDDVVTSLVFYNNLAENLDGSLDTAGENDTYYANGRMLSATIQLDNVTQLDFVKPIKIVFEHINQNATEETSHCVYWSYNDTYSTGGVWSTYGCRKGEVNTTHTVCYCFHLTSFCVLLQVADVQLDDSNSTALSLITYVGLTLTLVTLIITLIIMVVYFKRLNYECTSIHINLVIALIIADALFLFGINKTSKKGLCTSIAIFLHYFYLVVFMWMAVEALHMYNKVRSLNQSSRRKFYMYYPIGWGIPAVIVIITMAVRIDGYGTDTACWLDISSGTVWAFIGPVIVVISLNVIIIGMVLKIFSGVKTIKSKPKREQIRRTLRAMVILLPIFGVTWIFGLMAFNRQTLFFQYMFVIFNSLQGFFIFLFHCCFNVEIRNLISSQLGIKVHDGTAESQSKSSSTRRTQGTVINFIFMVASLINSTSYTATQNPKKY
ncbi:uncharacterized protein LOC117117204 [Anneissia japonica]|uniref:uncharacterized protein LOC117117204 n=1 Tax=Anneissia japonica TaxID=1529436 RepID=UPI00142557E4|nr:uncharacterized protein LOC117117204 [Anneissia japonica]